MNLNLNFEFGPVWYRPKPEPVRTGLTGNRSNRTGSHRFCKPWSWEHLGPAKRQRGSTTLGEAVFSFPSSFFSVSFSFPSSSFSLYLSLLGLRVFFYFISLLLCRVSSNNDQALARPISSFVEFNQIQLGHPFPPKGLARVSRPV